MRVREIMRRSCAVTAMAALVMHHVGPMLNIRAAEPANESGVTGQRTQQKGKKDYIVKFKTKAAMKQSTKTYEESTEINQNGEDKLEENKLVSLELSGKEAEQLETNQSVEFVEEDKEVSACGEKYFAGKDKKKHKKVEKRHKKNESKVEWNVQMIHAENKAKKSNNKVKIAILDSGVDWGNDIDLAYQTSLVPGEEEMTQMFMDGSGHGSSVASLIAAKDNGEGITGINPNAEIYSYRVLGDGNKAPISRVVEAIYMAINHKVNIINMSFGTTQYSEALHQAIKDANEEGILIIAAAGNTGTEGGNVEYPAAFPEVMAVGAVNSNAELSDISADGKEIDVVAPGENVKTASSFGLETVSSGTSMAAPHVVGLASILWQEDMTKSSQYIKELIMDSAKKLEDNNTTYKLIDIDYAVGNYKQFDKNYGEKSDTIEKNVSKPIVCNEMAKVTARWSKNKHGLLVLNNANGKLSDEQVKMIRAGIRYNDEILSGSGNSNAGIEYDRRVWHSLTRRNNYMATINFVGRIIQSENCDINIKYDSVLHFSEANMDSRD